jgi:hypothetical protein
LAVEGYLGGQFCGGADTERADDRIRPMVKTALAIPSATMRSPASAPVGFVSP